MKFGMLTAGAVLLSLMACGSDDTSTSSTSGDSVVVTTVSGVTLSLDGAWARDCHFSNDTGSDSQQTHIFSGSTITVADATHTTVDGSCGGTPTVKNIVVTAVSGSVAAISGWVDGMDTASAPPNAEDGSGALSGTEAVTMIGLSIVSAPAGSGLSAGDTLDTFYVVDDTVPALPVMYSSRDTTAMTAGAFDVLRRQ